MSPFDALHFRQIVFRWKKERYNGQDGEKERKRRHVCTQDSSAKAKMKRHVEIYILADGSTCCQGKKLKYQHDAKHTKPLGAEGAWKEQGQTEAAVMSK